MDNLRNGIGLRGYGQRDPLVEYKSEAYRMFELLNADINREIVHKIFKVTISPRPILANKPLEMKHQEAPAIEGEPRANLISPARKIDAMKRNITPAKAGIKIGRNDPCPCGSGKKYKKCFMQPNSGCKLQG